MRYRFGEFLLDTGRFDLSRDGQAVPIEPKVLKLIAYLIENRDRTIPRSELHRHLWGKRVVTDNSLSVCMRMARNALRDDGRGQALIRTVPRVGYRFVADVEVSSVATVDIAGNTDTSAPSDPADLERMDKELLARPSVVVLPFNTIGPAGDLDIFAQGLTHDVTTRIGRTRSLFVIARGTAFQFDDRNADVREIGDKLGVRYVIHGAIQKSGKKLRITATLVNSATREEVWSDVYERKLEDFSELQEELAELIVGTLQTEVERAEQLRSLMIPSTNLDAWSAYHRGCWHMYRFRKNDIDLAERYFRRSIDLEPTVPRPYAGLSFICFERVFLNIDRNAESTIHRAFDYSLQAISIDPHDPMAHWALSRAYLLQGELELSRQELETAIWLNPSYAIAQYSLGWVGMQLGEHDLCVSRIDMARKLSPYDPLKFAMLGVYALNLALIGRTKEAAKLAKQSVVQPNAHYQVLAFAAVSHALDGQLRKGAEYFRRVRAVSPGYASTNFFSTYKFRQPTDIARIERAFNDLESYLTSA